MSNIDHETVELILIAVTAAAVLLQAFVLLAMYLGLKKSSAALLEKIEDLKSSINPFVDDAKGFLDNAKSFLERVGPKVDGSATDIADITRRLRVQAAEIEASAAEVHEFVRKQTSRIDEMLSGLLNSVDRATTYVVDVVSGPVRQVAGVMASIRAIVESLRRPIPKPHETPTVRDRETFI
jgi:methyl-accepting chemotaxis protein